ncbi:MAG: carboxypeptidase regulatory-like domain-containing protein [Terriglobia bacterium]
MNECVKTGWALVCVVLYCALSLGRSFGAPAEKGAVFGTVRDVSGAVIRNAKVTLKSATLPVTAETFAQSNGSYTFTDVRAGMYIITVEAPGIERAKHTDIKVESGQRTKVDFRLKPSPSSTGGAVQERSSSDSGALAGRYYDDGSFKPSPLASSGEAAGYSSGAQARVSRRLLEETEGLQTYGGSPPSVDEFKREIRKLLLQGDSARLQELSGKEKVREEDFAGAATEYERAAQMDPNESNLFNCGAALLLRNAYPAAQEAFLVGLEHYPQSPRLRLGLGTAQYLRGEYDEAVLTFILASDLDPSDTRPYVLLGQAYIGATVSESTVVVEHLRRFVQLQPKNALAYYYCALGLWKGVRGKDQGSRLDEIESLLKRALDFKPDLADAHLQLGAVYDERQMPPAATEQYQQAIRLQPGLALAHYHLAQLYLRTGDKARASEELAVYERLCKQEDTNPSAKPQPLLDSIK